MIINTYPDSFLPILFEESEDLFDHLEEFRAAYLSSIKPVAHSAICRILKPIFDFDENITAINWIQYTVSDFEAKSFSVYFEPRLYIDPVLYGLDSYHETGTSFVTPSGLLYQSGYDPSFQQHWPTQRVDELTLITNAFHSALDSAILTDLCLAAYGNPSEVTVYKNYHYTTLIPSEML